MNLPENSHLTLSVLHTHHQIGDTIDVWAVIIVNTITAILMTVAVKIVTF